jgi:NitT/TauT family transport system substrate-binding protein
MERLNWILIFFVILFLILLSGFYIRSDNSNTITVGYLPCDHDAALLVAEAQGTYQNNGLNVNLRQISTGSSIVSAMASGDVDIGYVGITPALQGISQGMPIKVVAAVNLDGSGIVVDPQANITNTTDLRGKKVATPGVSSIQQVLLLYQLNKYNMTSKDLDILSINIFMLPSTLASKKIDAYIAYEPYVSIAPYRNTGNVLMYSDQIMPGHPCCVIVARQDFIDQHPDQLQKFLEIHNNTTKFVINNKNVTAQLISQQIPTNPSLEQISLQHVTFVSEIDTSFQDNVMNFMKIEQQLGYFKSNLTKEQIFDTSFLGG